MLEQLSVRNFAIIEQIDLELSTGMTVFSGETGAGKSLIVDALGFLLGAKADSSIIREGATECLVSGVFSVGNAQEVGCWLREKEIEWSPEEAILLRRIMRQNGRSLAWIQDRQVARNELVEFTQYLVDIHGQHEHQRLIDSATHIDMLDAYAALEQELQGYGSVYGEWRRAIQEYRELLDEKMKRSQESDYLEFVTKEIAAVKPRPDEDAQLEAEEKILSQHEKLFGAITEANTLLGAGEGTDVLHALRRIRADIESARAIDSRLGALSERLSAAYYELEDISESIHEYQANLRFDPARLEHIEQRLAELQRLKRKYGPQLSDVLVRYEQARATLDTLAHADENVVELEQKVKVLREKVFSAALHLSERRMSAAVSMSTSIEEIIRELGMPDARVHLRVTRAKDETGAYRATSRGIDEVEFYIAPNPGEPERPLSRIASGGELSRFALALKAVLAAHDVVDTLVFDEIDTGIGGQVGVAVGAYLKQLSQYRQVLCVTHLATIAAHADQQYKVDKQVVDGRTSTSLHLLSRPEREIEIARMLSGAGESHVSRTHAAELLDRSRAQTSS
jgi:DNA repair protein RecN (Recombination protein N)